ncbi:MAG: aminoglycoside phosphotransferase, partial [Chloroflexota bacterium]
LAALDGARVQPVHGDFHVGQVLRSAAGLAVIDFDGNPVAPADALGAPDLPERDLAGLLCSIDHVGRIVARRLGPSAEAPVARWIAAETAAAAGAYADAAVAAGRTRPDADRVRALRVEQEMRELLYAAEHLPRWRYAPMGAIRAMVPR